MKGMLLNSASPYDTFPMLHDANLVVPVYMGHQTGMVLSVPHASRRELRAVTMGQVSVAARVWPVRDAGFINWKFESSTGFSMYVRAPMHALLMDIRLSDYDPLDVMGLGTTREVLLLVQDEGFILRASRVVTMPKPISDLLAPILLRQLRHQRLPRWELRARVSADVERYMDMYPDPEQDFDTAPASGQAT